MKKVTVLFLLTIIAAIGAAAQAPAATDQAPYVRPNAEKRFKHYVNDTVGPYAWVGIAASSGFSTAINAPEEWGKSWNGFGKRVASNFGKNVIKNTAIYGLDEALKLDSHYYRGKKRDVGSRIGNAFLSTVTARKPNGKRTVGVPRIVGTFTADIVANEVWYPARYNWKDGMQSGAVSLGINSIFNLVKEFVFKN